VDRKSAFDMLSEEGQSFFYTWVFVVAIK
jgi:hypothetical protein